MKDRITIWWSKVRARLTWKQTLRARDLRIVQLESKQRLLLKKVNILEMLNAKHEASLIKAAERVEKRTADYESKIRALEVRLAFEESR